MNGKKSGVVVCMGLMELRKVASSQHVKVKSKMKNEKILSLIPYFAFPARQLLSPHLIHRSSFMSFVSFFITNGEIKDRPFAGS